MKIIYLEESCNDDPNAIFDQCDLGCQKTCDNEVSPDCKNNFCTLNGMCVCGDGFVKYNEKCILPEFCHIDIDHSKYYRNF